MPRLIQQDFSEERRGEERRGVEEDERGVMGEAGSHTLSVQALVN
jgi:hypothetical protein